MIRLNLLCLFCDHYGLNIERIIFYFYFCEL